ncbi:hypothetical protein NM208_g4235 [Fusarium decemcellulare]|uniref:Uncharacterized protein n=1 Tax=Fusarium decemcellulare TaxID=57161 RepID=A0ACC1SLJ6_9HYPO|nr:hypothetical protein NM208_g4235 [Fusarium decemcellulare]
MPQAARIPESDWERNKELVRALYLDQNMKLEQLVGCMKTLHGFSASKAQYVRRLDKWGFRKNYTKAEWDIAGSQVRRRKEKEGKETQLVMNGRPVSAKKLKKQLGRYIWSWTFGPQPQLASKPEVKALKQYLEDRAKDGPSSAVIPEMGHLSTLIKDSTSTLPIEILFTIVDLFRCALSDPRVSGFFAEEKGHETVRAVLDLVNKQTECPYALRLVTLQMACNFFSTPLFPDEIMRDGNLRAAIILLVSSSFLDESHNNVRVAASSLLFNLSLANRKARKDSKPSLSGDDELELAASVVEAISLEEKSAEALHGMLLALGHLVYGTALDGELPDLLQAVGAEDSILAKKSKFQGEKLITEVGTELLGKGLRKP